MQWDFQRYFLIVECRSRLIKFYRAEEEHEVRHKNVVAHRRPKLDHPNIFHNNHKRYEREEHSRTDPLPPSRSRAHESDEGHSRRDREGDIWCQLFPIHFLSERNLQYPVIQSFDRQKCQKDSQKDSVSRCLLFLLGACCFSFCLSRSTIRVSRAATFPKCASIRSASHNQITPRYQAAERCRLHALVGPHSLELRAFLLYPIHPYIYPAIVTAS